MHWLHLQTACAPELTCFLLPFISPLHHTHTPCTALFTFAAQHALPATLPAVATRALTRMHASPQPVRWRVLLVRGWPTFRSHTCVACLWTRISAIARRIPVLPRRTSRWADVRLGSRHTSYSRAQSADSGRDIMTLSVRRHGYPISDPPTATYTLVAGFHGARLYATPNI